MTRYLVRLPLVAQVPSWIGSVDIPIGAEISVDERLDALDCVSATWGGLTVWIDAIDLRMCACAHAYRSMRMGEISEEIANGHN